MVCILDIPRGEGLNFVERETFDRKVTLKVFETTGPIDASVGRRADFLKLCLADISRKSMIFHSYAKLRLLDNVLAYFSRTLDTAGFLRVLGITI